MYKAIPPLTLVLSLAAVSPAWADGKDPYLNMAPLAQYLMPQADEIALAKSAGPAAISADAEVIVLTPHGYETAVKGTNGFVCYVGRSWEMDIDAPEFWNPKVRNPTCANAAATRWYLTIYRQRVQWVLSGISRAEMIERTKAAIAAKQITAPEAGAMSFMLSQGSYIADAATTPAAGVGNNWYPHVMFWGPPGPGSNWGANVTASPVIGVPSDILPLTMYFIPVRKWSDGTAFDYNYAQEHAGHSH